MTDPITVARSLDRILKIGNARYRLYAEDWETDAQAEQAASYCAVTVNLAHIEKFMPEILGDFETELESIARAKLGVDDTRPYGFSVIVEPCE